MTGTCRKHGLLHGKDQTSPGQIGEHIGDLGTIICGVWSSIAEGKLSTKSRMLPIPAQRHRAPVAKRHRVRANTSQHPPVAGGGQICAAICADWAVWKRKRRDTNLHSDL